MKKFAKNTLIGFVLTTFLIWTCGIAQAALANVSVEVQRWSRWVNTAKYRVPSGQRVDFTYRMINREPTAQLVNQNLRDSIAPYPGYRKVCSAAAYDGSWAFKTYATFTWEFDGQKEITYTIQPWETKYVTWTVTFPVWVTPDWGCLATSFGNPETVDGYINVELRRANVLRFY